MTPDPRRSLEQAIAALQAQRATLGDEVLALALAPLQAQLAALAGAAEEQQLRQVSVLFTDIVGSTALSQHLDPEDLNIVLDGTLRRLASIVTAHGGRVLQYAGDNILAAFGADGAHEDDPARAVTAGLAILAEGRAQAQQVLAEHGREGYDLRVGIHTGGVLLGGGVDGENSIRGLTVNIAARMEQTAPPGMLRISHDTYRHVRGLFEVTQQPPLVVKGRDEPLVTYLVQGAAAGPQRQAQRGVEGLRSPLVGRAAELALLQQAWAARRGTGLTAITLVADPGVGKSRLVAEFRQATDRALWLVAQAGERSQGQPFGVLRELFFTQLQILGSDTPAVQRAKWSAGLAPLLPAPADAAVLGHLIGLDFAADPELRSLAGDARQLRDRGFFHASQWLRALAASDATATLALLLEDLHWADDATLEFLDYLQRAHADLPVLVVATARPTLFERRPDFAQTWPRHRRIALAPLAQAESAQLADALLQRLPEVPERLRELLTVQAEGNPFYMEELVNLLIDQGVIATGDGDWRLQPGRLSTLQLPTTLVGVLQARLDALPADERRTAQLASVVGFRFWDDSLVALGAPLPATLQGLIDHELTVAEDESSLEGMREYAFRHHIQHRVAYDSVLKRIKRAVHAKVARWLVALPGAAPLDLIAEHYERGGESEPALDYWQRAAEAAAARYANAQAAAHAGRALALVAAPDLARRYALVRLRVRAFELTSERDALDRELEALLALARELGDTSREVEAVSLRARYHHDGGDLTAMLEFARRAVALESQAAPRQAALARASLAQALMRLGRNAEASAESTAALALARASGDLTQEAIILNDLGMIADDDGDPAQAIAWYEQALARHRELGNRNNEGGTLSNLGYAALVLGDYEAACAQFDAARELFARIGRRQNEGITLVNLAIARLNQQRSADALAHATRALTLLRAAQDRWSEGAALRVIAQCEQALGNLAVASEHYRAALALFDAMPTPHLALEPMAGLAAVALLRGDTAAAMQQVEAILARLDSGVSLAGTEEPMRVRLICCQALAAAGDARAGPALAAAHAELQERAARIEDPARRESYLRQVPFHREIAAAWAAAQG